MFQGRKNTTNNERFFTKFKNFGEFECWEWLGCLDKKGYGVFWDSERKRNIGAHRYSLFGQEDSDLMACHHCNNPKCVNPIHLYKGTAQENTRDTFRAGNQKSQFKGREKHPQAKLTENLIESVKNLYTLDGLTQRQIAFKLKVNPSTISRVLAGKTWSQKRSTTISKGSTE